MTKLKRTLRLGKGKFRAKTQAVLQAAMDELAATGGGVLEIPRGTYLMNDSLHLRSGVAVVGKRGAIFQNIPSVTSKVAHCLGYGHYEFAVEEPDRFAVGMGVHLTDDRAGGFYDTVATIVERKGDLFFIDRMLNHDYNPMQQGRVTSVFPLISAHGVRDASVRGLALVGHPEETRKLNGCRGGGVFLLQSHDVRLEDLEIANYRGDGISFQQCTDIAIRDCRVHHNHGGGIHPGSGSVRYRIANNQIEHNEGYGIFYCLRTTHSLCEGNTINSNGQAGISVGERDTDHIIRRNTIRDNQGPGLELRKAWAQSGDRLLIEHNNIEHNCQREGDGEIIVLDGIQELQIRENVIQPAEGKAMTVGTDCARIYFSGNKVSGRDQREDDVIGDTSSVTFAEPSDFLRVGLHAAATDAARHLHIPSLRPAHWKPA